jgi:glutathione S-transferase
MATLVHYHASPWSERARWALDYRGVQHRRIEHVPMLGEPLIRLWMRRPFDKVTVPLLLAEEARLGDSLAIARWADARGRGPSLFPRDRQVEITRFHALSERILVAGRGRVTPRIQRSKAACLEAVPTPLRRLGRVASVMAVQGAGFVMRKYGTKGTGESEHLEVMRAGLSELREALAGDRYLLGSFTYADLALAVALQPVRPVSDEYLRLGPATRQAWTEPELAEQFADLLSWRDELYERHR